MSSPSSPLFTCFHSGISLGLFDPEYSSLHNHRCENLKSYTGIACSASRSGGWYSCFAVENSQPIFSWYSVELSWKMGHNDDAQGTRNQRNIHLCSTRLTPAASIAFRSYALQQIRTSSTSSTLPRTAAYAYRVGRTNRGGNMHRLLPIRIYGVGNTKTVLNNTYNHTLYDAQKAKPKRG
jgi:hypothetical protein